MGDQRMLYTPGALVWMKVYNRVWWPGKVVDPMTAPEELQNSMNSKKIPIALVHFDRDDVYDIVTNPDKVALYSCSKKMEFLEKGYSLYLKQKRSSSNKNAYMIHFVEDVLKFETKINGDINIFKNFDKKEDEHTTPLESINDNFVPIKQIKKKKVIRKSKQIVKKSDSQNTIPQLPKIGNELPAPIPFAELENHRFPKIKRVRMKSNAKPKPKKKSGPIHHVRKLPASPPSSGKHFVCHLKAECNFKTKKYEVLKNHMAFCKTTMEDKTNNEYNTQTPNKRKNATNQNDTKKLKMPDELLDDCDHGWSKASSTKSGPSTVPMNPVHKLPVVAKQTSCFGEYFACHLKVECNFITKKYESLKRHMAFCKATVEDETNNEFNTQTPNKKKNATNQNDTNKLKMPGELLDDCDGREYQDNNSSNNDTEPGSTLYTKNNFDENAIKNMEIFENAETIENIDYQREAFNYGNSSGESNNIEELMEDLISIVEQGFNSYGGSTHSETNNNQQKN